MADEETKSDDVEVVYLGQRMTSTPGKACAMFITPALLNRTTKGTADGRASAFGSKNLGHMVVGGVYRTTGKIGDDDRVEKLVLGSMKFIRRIESPESAEWELHDDAARAEVRAASQARKIKGDRVIHEELKMVRRLWMVSPVSLRPALELAILKAIRGVA